MKKIKIELNKKTEKTERIAQVLKRKIEERCGIKAASEVNAEINISLDIDAAIGKEGFRIENGGKGSVKISGNEERGLLYGVGKFLRTSVFMDGNFVPSSWAGRSVPEKEVRGIYFATHFHNFYHDAPVEKVERYVEDLGLWGYNALNVWFDMHHYCGINDPEAQKMIKRLRSILTAAKRIGMGTSIGVLANEGYGNSPQELRLTPPTQIKARGMYGVELCPNKPGARELMMKCFEEEFRAFSGIELDYLWIWPYDQGGCGCGKCAPWGANGFLMMAKPISELARKIFPNVKIVLSTWLFDCVKDEGEWEGMAKAFTRRPDWVDYILADSHSEFPLFPVKRGVPGNLPMINFPEISMWDMYPWGGFGANPGIGRFQKIWDPVKGLLSGGFPYSEGIFEDINKAVISQFYWEKDKKASDTLKEYIAYEYSPDVVEEVAQAAGIMEENHKYFHNFKDGQPFAVDEKREIPGDAGAEKAYELMKKADAKLSGNARNSWRWRILFLRALIDSERFSGKSISSEKCREAFGELTKIYHAQNALECVAPPVASNK